MVLLGAQRLKFMFNKAGYVFSVCDSMGVEQ